MAIDGLDYLKPIEIADGVYWVGYSDDGASLQCNPYIIIDGDEAVLIDSGSRDEFSTVMLKVLRLGVNPQNIKVLIYHHSDPDLCASIPQFEAIIDSSDLEIISDKSEHLFIRYYSSFDSSKSKRICIDKLGYEYNFNSGRKLKFISIPYAHSSGSFMTYDTKTKTLFSSDLFGSFDKKWGLYRRLPRECRDCTPKETCRYTNDKCALRGIVKFHKVVMPCCGSLRYALEKVKSLDIQLIAPQHGSLIDREFDKNTIIKHLESLEDVGFDSYIRGVEDESKFK